MEKNENVIGEKVKLLRKEKKMTLAQLSKKTGISTGYISKIERGTVNPTIKYIQRICFAFGVTANQLMIDKNELERHSPLNQDESYIMRKSDRLSIYGITNSLKFESIFEGSPNFKVNAMTLEADMQEQSYSIHSYDEFGIVSTGILGIAIDEINYMLSGGDCILIPKNKKHTVTNLSNEECVSYWIEITNP